MITALLIGVTTVALLLASAHNTRQSRQSHNANQQTRKGQP